MRSVPFNRTRYHRRFVVFKNIEFETFSRTWVVARADARRARRQRAPRVTAHGSRDDRRAVEERGGNKSQKRTHSHISHASEIQHRAVNA